MAPTDSGRDDESREPPGDGPHDPAGDLPNDPTDDLPTIDSGRLVGSDAAGEPRAAARNIGGFHILGKLGEGGMGIVYEAEQQNPRRRVALKVIRGGQFVDELYPRLLQREAETLARLAHPNIATLYEAGRTDDGLYYFTMELVQGRTLGAFVRDRLGDDRPTSEQLRERLRFFVTICRAVNYAHQRGVIHRDLKPANVLITEAGDVKILDFGLARITAADVAGPTVATELGVIKGTLSYMSPEQARGDSRDVDLRTDVYTLGVILYELIAGRPPYEIAGSSVVQAIHTICEEPPRPLKTATRGALIGADLQTITEKALAKEPNLRYQSAGALAEDIDRYLTNQPILAHPPSTMYQIRKLVSRHKGSFAALGAIGILLVALMVTMAVQSRRVRLERDRATTEAAKSEAINRFLLDALGGADPWARGSRTVSLVDALHQAQASAHIAFRRQPLVEASVLQTIGTTFSGLAEFAKAETALRAALDLRTREAGRRSAEVAESLGALAALSIRSERFSETETYAREELDIAREVHGGKSLEAVAAMSNLATSYVKQARLPETKRIADEALRIMRNRRAAHHDGGPQEDEWVRVENSVLSALGEVALREENGKEMERIDGERLTLLRARASGPDADQAYAMNDLATAQMINGDLAGAEKSYREAIDMAKAALGDDHPSIAAFRENLGNVYFRQGKLDLTARNLEEVLAMRRKALGDDSEPVARTMTNMGAVYKRLGRNELAVSTYREAIDRLSRTLGPDHPDVGIALLGLGDTLRLERQFVESESTLKRSLTILATSLGEDNPRTQQALRALVNLYTDWKKPAQAAEFSARVKS